MQIPRPLAIIVFALPWVAALCGFGWIVLERFPLSGVFIASSNLDGKSAFIYPFLPAERTSTPGKQPDGWVGQRVLGDPVYASARVPGPYETADVTIEFRPVRQPLIEFGVVHDAAGSDLELQPLYASELASPAWLAVDGGFIRSGTLPGRLRDPDTRGLAVWDATSLIPALSDAASTTTATNVSLRGSHDIYLVPAGGSIDVMLTIQDVNRTAGASVVAIRLYRGDQELQHDVVQTNGSRETTMGKTVDRRITYRSATPGVYRIAFQASDDVFIRTIKTTSRRWVIGPRLNFGDIVGYATATTPGIAWTTSRHLTLETVHSEGLQTVSLGNDRVAVKQTHAAYQLNRTDTTSEPVSVVAPRRDIRIVGDGFFALRPEAFFEPKPKRMTDAADLVAEHIVGVLTPYQRPLDLGDGWLSSTLTFNLQSTQDKLRFILASPGIADRNAAVDIRRISISYHRPPLTTAQWLSLLVVEIKNAWHRL